MTVKCARCDNEIEKGPFCSECRSHLYKDRNYQLNKTDKKQKLPPIAKPVEKSKFSESPMKPPPSPPQYPPPPPPRQYPPPPRQYQQYQPYPQHPYYDPYYQYYYNQYYRPPSDAGKILAGIAILPSYLFLGIVLLVNIIMLIVGLGYVVPYTFENVGGIAFVYPWPPYLSGVYVEGGAFLAWYLFLVAVILISVIWLIYTEGRNFLTIIISSAKRIYPPPSRSTNGFVMTFQLFFATIFFSYIVIIIMLIFQIPVTSPEPERIDPSSILPQLFYSLANASVAEEFAVRILYIGLPLLIIHAARGSTKPWYRYLVGGEFEMTPIVVFFLIFSSAVFAMAHTTNWGYWKAVPTFVAGLALGYLFLKKGIHTAIILHFSIDYMVLFLLASMESGEMGSVLIYGVFLVFSIIVWFFVGMVFFGIYSYRALKYVFIDGFGTRKEPIPVETEHVPEAIYLDHGSQSPPQPPPQPRYPPPPQYPPHYDPYYYHYYYYNYYYPRR